MSVLNMDNAISGIMPVLIDRILISNIKYHCMNTAYIGPIFL